MDKVKFKKEMIELGFDFPITELPNQDEHHNFSNNDQIKSFVLGGKSIFTIQNILTGNRFTYKVIKAKKNSKLFWINVLVGRDNLTDYKFIGCFSLEQGFKHSTSSKISNQAISVKAMHYYINRLFANKLPSNIRTYHLNFCGRCGKALTVPSSVESGFGPDCQNAVIREQQQLRMF